MPSLPVSPSPSPSLPQAAAVCLRSHAAAESLTAAPHRSLRRLPLALLLGSAVLLSACGGGGGGDSSDDSSSGGGSSDISDGGGSDSDSSVSVSSSFPTGLAVAAPTDISSDISVTQVQASPLQQMDTLLRAAWQALHDGDGARLQRLAARLLPLGEAHAAGGGAPDLSAKAEIIGKILEGDSSVRLSDLLDLAALFGAGGYSVDCYGPQMLYSQHEDGGGTAAGNLPGGDLGLWQETMPDGTACVAAQLSARASGVRQKTLQGLLLAAAMRQAVAASGSLSMPAAGASTDLTSVFQSVIDDALGGTGVATVEAALIERDSADSAYRYRLVMNNGGSGAGYRRGEVVLTHTPGSAASAYSGVLQVASFSRSSDVAFGCTDEVDSASGLYNEANVSSVRYSRAGDTLNFGSRSAAYCGHAGGSVTGSSTLAQEVASFTADGELDPGEKLSGPTRGGVKGWRGNFTRFAGDLNRSSADGSYLLAWQAGTGDGHARALAASASTDAISAERSVQGYFAYTDDIASTSGELLGMICNWAGPGNSHTPRDLFQFQQARLSSSGSVFAPYGTSRITYAPTNSCSSTGTLFDADVSGAIVGAEGQATTHNLDAPASGLTVQQEVTSRGYALPSLF